MRPAPLACVMGDLDLVRPLARAGIRCAVLAPDDDPVHHSRHVAVDLGWVDHWHAQEQAVDRLLDFARSQPEPPPLFFQADGDLLLVSRHRERLATGFVFSLADAQLVEDLVDKARFCPLASRLDLPVPPNRHVRPGRDAPGDVDLRFPLVVKPLVRHSEVWSPLEPQAKAVHVATPQALAELWPRLEAADLEVIAQEAVPGPETRIESYHCYVDGAGRTAAEFTGRKLRTHPALYGHSSAVVITDEADVLRTGREAVERLKLRGVAKLDFKRAPDGSLHLLEVNPRFSLWHYPAAIAGVNVPAVVYADLVGLPRPATRPVRPGVTYSDLRRDVRAVGRSPLALARWLAWYVRCEAKWTIKWDDPMPTLRGIVLRLAGRRLRRLLGRRPPG